MDAMFTLVFLSMLGSITSQSCETKMLCRNGTNDDGKSFHSYFAGEDIADSIMNITVGFLNTTALNQKSCVRKCMLNSTCYSTNSGPIQYTYDGFKVNEFVECHLISENSYSNRSLIIQYPGWTHVTLKSTGCDVGPCENGGTCVPGYVDDTFTCECPIQFWGDYCERERPYAVGGTVTGDEVTYCHYPFTYEGVEYKDCTMDAPPSLTAVMPWCGSTADSTTFGYCTFDLYLPTWKFTFDESRSSIANQGIDQTAQFGISSHGKIVSVPDRPGNVVHVFGATPFALFSASNAESNCFSDVESCSGFTIAFWVKVLKKDLAVQTAAYPNTPKLVVYYEPTTGSTFFYDYKIRSWHMNHWSSTKLWYANSLAINPYRWTHLAMTHNGTYMGIHVNGKLQVEVEKDDNSDHDSEPPDNLYQLMAHQGHPESVPGHFLVDDFVYYFDAAVPVYPIYEEGIIENKLKALAEKKAK